MKPANFDKTVELFFAKAGCSYTQYKAEKLWREIKDHMTIAQRRQISVAWSHFLIGEGRWELDEIYKKIWKKYSDTE